MNFKATIDKIKRLKDKPNAILIAALVLTIALYLIPYGRYFLYPFKIFVTWVHEMSQGVAAEIADIHFSKIIIAADTNGVAHYNDGTTFRHAMVASAGYIGSAIFGSALILLRIKQQDSVILKGVSVLIILSTILFARSFFTFFILILIAAGIFGAAMYLNEYWRTFFLNFLAGQTCLDAILDIPTLYSHNSDAATVSKIFILPFWFWATLWILISLALLAGTYTLSLRLQKKKLVPTAEPFLPKNPS